MPNILESGRVRSGPYASESGDRFGAFYLAGPCGGELTIVSSGVDLEHKWEHVSVSLEKRTPNWREMCWAKFLFWDERECVVQYHPPKDEYVNCHPFTLHLWKMVGADFPMPPANLVGPK
jgi:hypothetical protein